MVAASPLPAPARGAVAARVRLMAAAALFSTGGAAIKATSLNGWQVASFRSAVAAVVLVLLLPGGMRRWTARTAAVGATYAATMVLFVLANKRTTAANTIFLQSTAPVYLLLLGPWLLHERLRRRDLGLLAAMAVGLSLFFVGTDVRSATAPDPFTGNVLALASGAFWALTMLGLRYLGRGAPPGAPSPAATAVVAGNVLAFLVTLPMALPVTDARPVDAALVVYLGVFQIGLAYAFVTAGLCHIGALEASLLLLVEPVLNPVWAWIVHGERPGPWAAAGGAIILGATAVDAWLAARRR